MAKLKSHPYADLFPMMREEEIEALTTDIAAKGLRQPIVRYQGMILDGRNRLAACEKAKVEPVFVEHEGDDESAHDLVISLNVQRRNLSASQLAIIAARDLPRFEEAAAKRKKAGKSISPNGAEGQARDHAAEVFGVGKNQVQQAKALLEGAPDLAARVEARELTISNAYAQHQQRQEEARRNRQQLKIADLYREAVEAGEMTLEEALKRVQEEKSKTESNAQARQLFFGELQKVLKWSENWVEDITDEHLAWYTEPGEPGTETDIEQHDLDRLIEQIGRIKNITFAPRATHDTSAKKGSKNRPRGVSKRS